MNMVFREALVSDIEQIQSVRWDVKENVLSSPDLVTDKDCKEFMTQRGKGWVCEIDNQIVGFAIADLKEHNIWALFVRPQYEAKGIGRTLHDIMLNWYFSQTDEKVWLHTGVNTRAVGFYRNAGWKDLGLMDGEVKFEMTSSDWKVLSHD